MRRMKPKSNGKAVQKASPRVDGNLGMYSALVSRAGWMAQLGLQYGGDRDLYQAFGYMLDIKYDDYKARYERQDIAAAIINRPVSATWRGGFKLVEFSDDKDTPLEKDWQILMDEFCLLSKFVRLDKLSGIGCYGVLLLGLADIDKNDNAGFAQPVSGKNNKLLYLKPLSEKSAKVSEWEKNPGNNRFGKPKFYNITLGIDKSTSTSELKVHYSRVLHVPAGQLLESETNGTPRLQAVFNRLMDLEKMVGGSAEMFWRGARPGYQGKVDENYTVTQETIEDLQNQLDEYENDLRRFFVNRGIDFKALEMQIADPSKHVDVQLQMISAVTGIPKRILTGAELGELASSQDITNWNTMVQSRRTEYAEAVIVRPFVDMCIEYGILAAPSEKGYGIEWADLWAPSDKEKAEVGKIRAEAAAAAGMVMPMDAVLQFLLGLTPEQAELINEMIEGDLQEEEKLNEDEDALLAEQQKGEIKSE